MIGKVVCKLRSTVICLLYIFQPLLQKSGHVRVSVDDFISVFLKS